MNNLIRGSWLIGKAGIALCAAQAVRRNLSRGGRQREEVLRETILDDVARWTAKQTGESFELVRGRLREWMLEDGDAKEILGIRRIETWWRRESPTKVSREVVVAHAAGARKLNIGRITRHLRWSDTPKEIRAGLITNPTEPVVYVMLGDDSAA